jgi:thymidylate kinase
LEESQLAVELRPRPKNRETVFSGDYDYLIDLSNFEEIVTLYFEVCLRHRVSFQLLQRSYFVKRLVIHGLDGRKIICEFWPHAELATKKGNKGWSFITYHQFVAACDAGFKQEALALIYITHLYFRKKDLANEQNQWRLEECLKRMEEIMPDDGAQESIAEKIREVLTGIIQGELPLHEANQKALCIMAENQMEPAGSGYAAWRRLSVKLGRIFKGWGGKVIPCAGPDGSGKSYFIDLVMKLAKKHSLKVDSVLFRHLFRKPMLYRFVNKRYRAKKGKGIERNVVDERLAPMVYWLALSRYIWKVLASFNKDAMFMDRFFLEFMVRGYREKNENGFVEIPGYSLLCRLLPEPRKMVVVSADNELITSRKTELSHASIDDFYERYIFYCVDRNITNVIFLNSHEAGKKLAERCLTLTRICKDFR